MCGAASVSVKLEDAIKLVPLSDEVCIIVCIVVERILGVTH